MNSLAQRSPGSLAFNPDSYDLVPNPPIFTCDGGKWRKYDAGVEENSALPFTRYESISIVPAKNGGLYLHVDLSYHNTTYAIRQRCDGTSGNGLLQLTAQSFIEGILGQHRMYGALTDCSGYVQAKSGNKPGASGHTGCFINVVDLTSGKPARVPKVMLDRKLSSGEFNKAVEMLSDLVARTTELSA